MPAGQGHYSGKNPVPNIQKFVESLDRDKADRDKRIDADRKAREAGPVPHREVKAGKAGTQKTVTDPTTGKEVVIEDVDKKTMQAVENPMVSRISRSEQSKGTRTDNHSFRCPIPTLGNPA